MLFENNTNDYNLDINLMNFINTSSNKSNEFFDLKTGLNKGTIFKNEYEPYKNYKEYSLIPNNDQEKLFLKIYELDNAIIDLNLYLDIYENDETVYNLFKKYVLEYNNSLKEYAKNYGPLELSESNYMKYEWSEEPWPFDYQGGSYV